jgi:hypothetical protein
VPFDLGDTVRLTADCKDAGGTLANATTVVLTITLPDGTTSTPAVTNPPAVTGRYTLDYTTVQAGLHRVRWLFTTPNNAYTDALDVREAVPPLLFSLADAKAKLRIGAAVIVDDDDLRAAAEATTRAVEYFTGPIVRTSYTDVVSGGHESVLLTRAPVLSLTSITAVTSYQVAVPFAVLDVDGTSGVVRRTDGLTFPSGSYRLAYIAGRTILSANISLAARIILQHLWRTMYGGSRARSSLGGGDDYSVSEPIPGLGFAVPNRALQLLQSDRQPEGMA